VAFELNTDADAGGFISPAISEPEMIEVINDLLKVGAGIEPSQDRTISSAQLSSHLESWAAPSTLEKMSFARSERALIMEKALAFIGLKSGAVTVRYLRKAILPSKDEASIRGGRMAYYAKVLPKRLGGQLQRKPGRSK
jgi:hypothetical protein